VSRHHPDRRRIGPGLDRSQGGLCAEAPRHLSHAGFCCRHGPVPSGSADLARNRDGSVDGEARRPRRAGVCERTAGAPAASRRAAALQHSVQRHRSPSGERSRRGVARSYFRRSRTPTSSPRPKPMPMDS
jgi:hypothetical protein